MVLRLGRAIVGGKKAAAKCRAGRGLGVGSGFRISGATIMTTDWVGCYWRAIDRRTVLLTILKGRDVNPYAILKFNEDMSEFEAYNFDGQLLPRNRRQGGERRG